MKNGFVKVAAATPVVRLADTKANCEAHIALAQKAYDEGSFEDIAYFEPFYLKDFVVTTSKKRLF